MSTRTLVITGDHEQADSTKWEGHYTAGDLELDEAMRAALTSLPGYEFDFLAEHDRLLERLRADPPDLALNFCDTGFHNVATQELHVPALLELLGISYTGSPPASLALCYDKQVVGLIAQDLGVPVPRGFVVPAGEAPAADAAFYPALLKPVRGDGSVGILPESVVRSWADAERYLERRQRETPGADVLWQEYLPGRELGLALIGNPTQGLVALPPIEVDYSALPRELPPILAFESKTGPGLRYAGVQLRRARLPDRVLRELCARSARLFERLQCRDYARFDFRTGADGTIKLLEVNPNPAWSYAAKMAVMAGFAGMNYAELLGALLETARARVGDSYVRETTATAPVVTGGYAHKVVGAER